MNRLDEKLISVSDKYNFDLMNKLSPEDKESNRIYAEIISILIKKPNIQLYDLIEEVNRSGARFEKNKIRNRRDRITKIHDAIDEAVEIVNLIDDEDYMGAEEKLKITNIVRDRMVIAILLEENFSEELLDLYQLIKNDQCRGFLRTLFKKMNEKENESIN
ncbi:MAG: hypothetical protein ACRCZ9_08990 [Fusobacteriaceae bacterium]